MGIFVEDRRSGKEAIHELARKIFQAKNIRRRIHMRFAPRNEMFDVEKMKAYLLPLVKQHADLSKILICIDSECTEPGKIQARVHQVERELQRSWLDPPIQYVVVVHAVEGWLAADADALSQVLETDVSAHVPADLESVCRPADLLSEIFVKCGKNFVKTLHDPRIAEHSDPTRMARRNNSFQQFQQAILDP